MHAPYMGPFQDPLNTFAAIAEAFYAVFVLGSATTIDPIRLARVVDALEQANPTALNQDGKIELNTEYVRLPMLDSVGYLPPVVGAITSSLQTQLLEAGLRDHSSVASASSDFLYGRLPTANKLDLDEAKALCHLMTIPGVSGPTAARLLSPTGSIQSPAQLAATDLDAFRGLVEDMGLFPSVDEQAIPAVWSVLHMRAKALAPPPVKDHAFVFGVPRSSHELRSLSTQWRATLKSNERTAKEKQSSTAIAEAYLLASRLMNANQALASGAGERALNAFAELLDHAATLASVTLPELTVNDVI